jgi:hypothetical protein
MTKRRRVNPVRSLEVKEHGLDTAEGKPPIDHSRLTNEELHRLVCRRAPHMVFLNVTDEIRETVIAMIEVSE